MNCRRGEQHSVLNAAPALLGRDSEHSWCSGSTHRAVQKGAQKGLSAGFKASGPPVQLGEGVSVVVSSRGPQGLTVRSAARAQPSRAGSGGREVGGSGYV